MLGCNQKNIIIKRNSSVEILKIVGTFLIVLHHMAEYVPNDFNNKIGDILLFVLSGHMGNLGNCIFIVASAIYLTNNEKIKPEKVIYLILFESLSAIIILFIRILAGRTICFRDIKFAIFPFLTNQYWWFINAYIIYYLIHGYLNVCINNISKENHYKFCFFSILLYSVLPVFLHNQLPTSTVTSFVIIHIFISYIKKYNMVSKISNIKNVWFMGGWYFVLVLISYELDIITGTSFFSWRSNVSTTSFYNIILLLFVVSLCFYLYNRKTYNGTVCVISSLSLLMFIVHYNPQAINYIRKRGWMHCNGLINYDFDRFLYIFVGIMFYLFCIFISLVYKKMFNDVIKNLSKSFTKKINTFCMYIYNNVIV